MKKSVYVRIILSVLIMLCMPVISMADDEFFVPEYTQAYKEWQALSEEEKQQVIEPQMYENLSEEMGENEIQPFSAEDNMVGANLPTKFSRNDYGEVRNQTTNLCWACSAATVFENNYRLTNYRIKQFSDVHMDYMTSKNYNNGKGFNRVYNTGGNINIALAYATNGMGIVEKGNLTSSNFKNAKAVAKVSDYDVIHSSEVKNYVYQYGVVSAYTYIGGEYFSSTNYWNNKDLAYYCSDSRVIANHAVTIIGWDDNYTNAAFPGQRGAYVALNSYGTQFGNQGLYYIFYNDVFVKNADFFVVTKTENMNHDNLYQYDEYGQTATIGWNILNGGTYAANVFTRQNANPEALTELGIYFPSNENVTVYINANGDNKNINQATYVFTTETKKTGYHTIKLPKEVELNNRQFTVCVKYHGFMGTELASNNSSSWWYTISSHYGESYVSRDGSNWRDLKTAGELRGLSANACIKAFTKNLEYTADLGKYVFDYQYYADHNIDLYQVFGYNEAALRNHWENFGKAEGRRASCIFDGKYYVENNADVKKAFGNNYVAAYNHFMTNGFKECRKSSMEYDGLYYRNNNNDLSNMTSMELIRHYALYGKNELRQASTNYDIVNIVFNAQDYARFNADLTATFGHNEARLKDHWLRFGIREGRVASLAFVPTYYLEKNPDVKKAFGNNYAAVYQHFIDCGFIEQRQASPVFAIQDYYASNGDLRKEFGNNYAKYLNHFVHFGKNEMRVASSQFNASSYKAKNPDINRVYGNDNVMYYVHYIQFGRSENRICK